MSNTKNIAKNTIFLYFRMLLVLGVSLFTSRIVLRELGISDYGIYSLVGGFIAIFSFLNSAMTAATQRYLTFDLGKNDFSKLQKTFSATLTIHFGIGLLVFILAETLGLWYLNNIMVFSHERSYAVNFVYQFSIIATLLGIIQVPYNALIIAREKMNVYAYVGIAEVLLKLLIVFLLVFFGGDKLIVYSVLTFLVAFGIRSFYQFYCRKNYKESHYKFEWDVIYYKELIYYSGWNLFGSIAVVAKGQGSNLVLNLFFGTTVNAAYGIMNTVNNAVNSFISNFQMASNPQIIKLYAVGDRIAMENLMNQTAKFSFYLSLILMAPVFLNIEYILKIWLVKAPDYTGIFVRLVFLCTLIDTISKPIMTGITATGKIRMYQIIIGIFNILSLPISYIFLKFQIFDEPQIILYVWLFVAVMSLVFRIYFLKIITNYNLVLFFTDVFVSIGYISLVSVIIGFFLNKFWTVNSIFSLILQTLLYLGSMIILIFFVGIKRNERKLVYEMKNKLLLRFRNRN